MFIAAIKNKGLSLKYASDELKGDKEVVMAAEECELNRISKNTSVGKLMSPKNKL